jgi:predicted metal-dependent peptidase
MKTLHPKLIAALEDMIIKFKDLTFYYHYLTYIDFVEKNDLPMPTMGVGIKGYKLTCFYTREFVENSEHDRLVSTLLHECLHLIHNHIKRTTGYDPRLSNIAQDMILNHIIMNIHKMVAPLPPLTQKDVDEIKASNPTAKVKVGDNSCVILDPNYKGELVFELLYRWLLEEHEKHQNGQPNQLSQSTKDMLDSHANGMTVDYHGPMDEAEMELKEQIGKELLEKVKMHMKGSMPGSVEQALELALTKPHNNNLSIVRKMISAVKGFAKLKSYRRLNKRVAGIKGKIKRSLAINVLLDVSGSMSGEFEMALSEIFRDGYSINLVQVDTRVNKIEKINRKDELKTLMIKGGGGTELTPGVKFVLDPANKIDKYPTVILTDGYTDRIDFQGSMNQFLILTTHEECPVVNAPNVKQIKIVQ